MHPRIYLTISTLMAVVYCRPQQGSTLPSGEEAVQVEKQHLVEYHPDPRQLRPPPQATNENIEDNTKDILQKIAQVNELHGLNKKKQPHFQHFPFVTYSRANEGQHRKSNDFKFPQDPFTNPIFEYLASQEPNKLRTPMGYNAITAQDEDEVPPGQYIKRKITHHQSMLVPMVPPQFYTQGPPEDLIQKQTVDYVKSIVQGVSSTPYGYYPYQYPSRPSRQQFQWPWQQYFPIVIKDPVMQMFNAFTSMVEYGPMAGGGTAACMKQPPPKTKPSNNIKIVSTLGDGQEGRSEEGVVIEPATVLEIEGIEISGGDGTVNGTSRESKQNTYDQARDLMGNYPYIKSVKVKQEPITTTNKPIGTTTIKQSALLRQSPPIRDQLLDSDELESEAEEYDKAEDIQVSSDGNKKLFSKDNTGSGIFIHRLKVRKGGVAIAGPGGIATAGSGGTAIVGPNGFAYTHPDSLAIAGSGTKVVAVDPTINLMDIVNGTLAEEGGTGGTNHRNRTRPWGHRPRPPPRVGKVVAIGPVVYYNRG